MSGIGINIKNLKIARENSGYPTLEATHKICGKNGKGDKVFQWENGEKNPTWNQLKKMADLYHVNIFVLTHKTCISKNREIKDFRASNDGKDISLNTKKYLNFLLQRQQYLSAILKSENANKNELVGCGTNIQSPERLAQIIRQKLGYQYDKKNHDNHLRYVISLLENQGVFVMKTLSYWSIDVSDMRGVYLHDDYAPIIALNRKDAKTAQLFTLAHEIAHLCINSEAISNIDFKDSTTNAKEQFCNQFAAHFLLPGNMFDDKICNIKYIENIADSYKLSTLFVFYRLKNLQKISHDDIAEYEKRLLETAQNNSGATRTQSTGGNFNNNMKDSNGNLFNTFIASLYFQNKINAFEASKILKLSIENI